MKWSRCRSNEMSAILIEPRIFVEQMFGSKVRKTPYNLLQTKFCDSHSKQQ